MTTQELVKLWLKNRIVEDMYIGSTVSTLTLVACDDNAVPTPAVLFAIYASVELSENSGSISISCPSLNKGLVDKSESIAACSLVLSAKIIDVHLELTGVLTLDFDSGLSLTVANTSDSFEKSWAIYEPESFQNSPKIEVYCSNRGVLDQYKIG